jgi:hypothetical protein
MWPCVFGSMVLTAIGSRVLGKFWTLTEDLLALRDWLVAHGLTRAGIEAAGMSRLIGRSVFPFNGESRGARPHLAIPCSTLA